MPEAHRSAPAANPHASYCQGCSRKLRPGERFCSGCGRSTAALTAALSVAARVAAPPDRTSTSSLPEHSFAERWRALRKVGALYGAWLALSLATGLAFHFTRSPWLDVVASAVGVLLVLGFAIGCRDLGDLLRPRMPSAATTVHLAAVAVAFVLLLSGYYTLLSRLGVPLSPYLKPYRAAHWPLWSAFLLISVLPGIVEEIGFRGIIQSSLTRIAGAREAWLIQAALFSVLHLSPLIFPDHFLMGLCLGYLRTRSRSLYPGIALHAGWNALVLVEELLR